jgi:transposase
MSINIGIDVDKHLLQVALAIDGSLKERRTFKNTQDGRSKLASWCAKKGAERICMESTGPYSGPVAYCLFEAGLPAVVCNPRAIRQFAHSMSWFNKTDRADALAIARYAELARPDIWVPPPAEHRRLCGLSRRSTQLQEMRTQERNRLEDESLDSFCLESIRRSLESIEQEQKELWKEIEALVEGCADLREKVGLLCTIPGVSLRTACAILGEMATGVPFAGAAELCSYAGLFPRLNESGQFAGRSLLSKRGNSRLRRALYMPAVVALKCNPLIKEFYERLLQKSKSKKAALVACMRKLLSICYGVLTRRAAFCVSGA